MSHTEDIGFVSQVVLFGSEKAFRRLVDKYQAPVRRFFLHQTDGDEALSDDLAQETFIKVWQNIASFQGLASFKTWLFRIAYNTFNDYIRSHKEFQELETSEVDSQYQCSQPNWGLHHDLLQALKNLKKEERTCILLFYLEDISIAKISSITGLPSGTIKSHLSRAKGKIAKYLNQQGYDDKRR